MEDQDKQKIKSDDKPLFVANFQGGRIAWTLFCPYALSIFVFSAPIVMSSTFGLLQIICIFIIVGIIWLLGEMLLVENICIYEDRIIKKYKWLKRNNQVLLQKAEYSATSTPFLNDFTIADDRDKILFDPTLMSSEHIEEFYIILAQLTGRDIDELKNKALTAKLIAK